MRSFSLHNRERVPFIARLSKELAPGSTAFRHCQGVLAFGNYVCRDVKLLARYLGGFT